MTSAAKAAGSCQQSRWPRPGKVTSRAPGIRRASSWLLRGIDHGVGRAVQDQRARPDPGLAQLARVAGPGGGLGHRGLGVGALEVRHAADQLGMGRARRQGVLGVTAGRVPG